MTEPIDDLLPRLAGWRDDTRASLVALSSLRQRTEENARMLESPSAVLEFLDFFSGFFTEAVATFERIGAELEQGPKPAHAEALRQLASNAAVEQRRCLKFRDKWINRPLPYEEVRPLLTEIPTHIGNRLAAYRDLHGAADSLDALIGPGQASPGDGRALDRRALFTKWFNPGRIE
jgi:hypothetical protein